MKKVLSIFLATLFCISSALGMFTTVSAEESSDISKNLVVHYDFEGSTSAEILSNKVGSTSLGVANNSANGISFSDGVVSNKNVGSTDGKRAYLHRKVVDGDAISNAIEGGDTTLIVRFKVDPEQITSGEANLPIFDMASTWNANAGLRVMGTTDGKITVGYVLDGKNITKSITGVPANNTWVTLAVTIGKNVDGTWNMTIGYTTDDRSATPTWTEVSQTNTGTTRTLPANNTVIKIFGNYEGTGLVIDDIKLYDVSLAQDQITEVTRRKAVNYVGYQPSVDADDSKFSARFVATVDSLDYSAVGMEVTVTSAKYPTGKTFESVDTGVVYKSLLAQLSDGTALETAKITAGEYDAPYLLTLTVKGIPEGEEIVCEVKPYVIGVGETEKVYGDSYTITFHADGTSTSVKN